MMGIVLSEGLAPFPQGFPPEILEAFVRETGVPGSSGTRPRAGR